MLLAWALMNAASPTKLWAQAERDQAFERGGQFLRREVVRWTTENGCRSCHNQGDATRVLLQTSPRADWFNSEPFQPTIAWLLKPSGWNDNQGDPQFNDKQLATLQFTTALAALTAAQPTNQHREALREATRMLLSFQSADGSWPVHTGGTVGSPLTYGSVLATAQAIDALRQLDGDEALQPIRKAESFLMSCNTGSVVNLAGVLLGLEGRQGNEIAERRSECATKLIDAQHRSGGWGPYPGYKPEVFDTAIAVVALRTSDPRDEVQDAIELGQKYLVQQQQDDGSWIETTRPDPQESYAHRVSTSAWATLALEGEKALEGGGNAGGGG
jgi:hypothetical protein